MQLTNKNKQIVENKLQCSSVDFQTLCLANDMYVNIPKTSVMSIGTRQKLQNFVFIEIYMNDEILRTTDTLLLGVIDKNLRRDSQIDSVCLTLHVE